MSKTTFDLVELDSLEILAIIDNELDPISPCPTTAIKQAGGLREIAPKGRLHDGDVRGDPAFELRMDNICCGAHGLSLLVTGIKDGVKHTILFDTGPEASSFETNAARLHWHRDHSGGMLKALERIQNMRSPDEQALGAVTVDLHPDRPDYRGVKAPNLPIVSLEADPSFDEISRACGNVDLHDDAHLIGHDMFLVSGEIPKSTEYEKGFQFGVRFDLTTGVWTSDITFRDERFVLCKVKDKGLVMLTGCSHMGVVNASRHAKSLQPNTKLHAVVGGFHLADAQPQQISDTVADLKAADVGYLLAGHCTGWRAKFEIERQMPGQLVPSFVGSTFTF